MERGQYKDTKNLTLKIFSKPPMKNKDEVKVLT